MIRTLKRRFVGVCMALVLAVLIAVAAFFLVSYYNQLTSSLDQQLQRTMQESSSPADKRIPIGSHTSAPKVFPDRSATFWVVTDSGGAILRKNVDDVDITEDSLKAVTAEVLSAESDSGTLNDPPLAYLRKSESGGMKIVFADRSTLLGNLRSLALRLAAVLGGSLAAFFAVSVFLSSLAMRPVARAWDQQKQFVADASHELKTPLTVILANTSIVESHSGESVASQQKWLDGIHEEGARMKSLIDELLFLAKSDAAGESPDAKPFDLTDAVWSSALAFESVAYEKGVSLETQIQKNLNMTGDEALIKRLVSILTDNAVKYAKNEKRVTVSLSARQGQALLRVTNTGPDLSAEETSHLFERFYRTEKSRARGEGGYGLGLAIAKTIAEGAGGTLGVQSSGGLTAFEAALPLERSAKGLRRKRR